MKTPTMAIQASHGRWFAVRYLPVGAHYGRSNGLTVEHVGDKVESGDSAQVEFWDLTHADDATHEAWGFGPLGQFVSRYYVGTLLGEDEWHVNGDGGLCLDGGHAEVWSIDAPSMKVVRSWLRRTRAELRHVRS